MRCTLSSSELTSPGSTRSVSEASQASQKPLVVRLEAAPDNPSLVGGKAASLGGLIRAGYRVPHGCCLTNVAYHRFVAASGLDRLVAEKLSSLDPRDLG